MTTKGTLPKSKEPLVNDKEIEAELLFGIKLNNELEGLNADLDDLQASIEHAAQYIRGLRAKVQKLNDSIEL